ncbi:P-loop containing nucleoside triphosphate hydrolase protein [Aspergillus transmontanensis]|uniref:P-loop containing nucleoside triphosphate hydrolase protein n=1 Tax=Aspergillus transmontanensis TaxID=1034304 RepID=A0A5N6W948_9EURO|nr:P-loop containing nucleoside triphosphate hydrolase protein [Aspergillus transmontanensis]
MSLTRIRNLQSHQSLTESSSSQYHPVHIEARDLSVYLSASSFKGIKCTSRQVERTPSTTRVLTVLSDIQVDIPPAKLTVLLGGSGCGKTSLLNVLSGRTQNSHLKSTGFITYNNNPNIGTFQSGYLSQQDILPTTLTVREILQYAAELSLSCSDSQELDCSVDNVLSRLGLKDCAENRIGDSRNKGCSGGEKRRVSIAIQLLKQTSVLFCDEPTTGLDATTAFQVIQTLKQLADAGMTIIMSLHSPRSDAWRLFDNIILLSGGHLIYSGASNMVEEYFKNCGFELPPYVNPADFLLEITSIDPDSDMSRSESIARLDHLKLCWKNHTMSTTANYPTAHWATCGHTGSKPKERSYRRRCKALIQRNMKQYMRDWKSLVGIWCAVACLAATNGWIFWQLDGSLTGIRSREGSLWDATGLYGYLILIHEICRLVSEIHLFDHERRDGLISASTFLLGRRLSKLLIEDIPLPLLFTAIYYPMVGYRGSTPQICIFLLIMMLTHYLAVGVALFCVATTRSFHGAGLMGNLYFTLQTIASGYFIQIDQTPGYARWLRWITHTFYTFGALATNEFIGVRGPEQGQLYDCPYSQTPTDPRCMQYTGKFVMNSLGIPRDWVWRPISILCSMTCIVHLAAAVVLHTRQPKPRFIKKRNTSDAHVTTVGIQVRPTRTIPIHICLQDYALETLTQQSSNSAKIRICGPISTDFQPGQLNVIMGASGCGKTSLLTSLAERIPSSNSSWTRTGLALYNGNKLPKDQTRAIVSFVGQDDGNLMPALTVGETLFFAARLTLPSSMSDDEKRERVSEVMVKFGLDSCAGRLVGSATRRGISGGERRRLSIACEVLTMPQVLVLDEPTSGLDSFMALTVLKTLQSLAAEGRTIVFTIHQPTSSMWSLFSTCLLLSPDGFPLYSGKASQMCPYFNQAGFECPRVMNPADFFMDLAAYRGMHDGYETEKQRICSLVNMWRAHEPSLRIPSDTIPLGRVYDDTRVISNAAKINYHSFLAAFPIVLHRAVINIFRQPLLILARSIQAPGVGVLLTIFAAPIKQDYNSVQTRMGAIEQYAPLAFIGLLQNIATFPPEVDTFYREASEGLYGTEAFLAQYTILEILFEAFSAMVFALLLSYATQLAPNVNLAGLLFLSALCTINSGESISMLSYLIFPHLGLAVSFTASLLAIFTVLGGSMSLDPPTALQWFNYISPIKYAMTSVSIFTLKDTVFTCTEGQRDANGTCPIQTGEEVLQLYNLDQKNPWLEVLGSVVTMLCYRLLVYVFLRVQVKRMNSRDIRGWFRRQRQSISSEESRA